MTPTMWLLALAGLVLIYVAAKVIAVVIDAVYRSMEEQLWR